MKLSKIQKNLNIQILEKGRQTFRNYYYPVVIYFFLSPFIVMPIFDVQSADAQFSLAFVMTIWTGPPIIVVILLFKNQFISYHRHISSSLKVNIWGFRPYSKQELNFIKKNFKKVKWKISMNILQNLKDEDTIRNLQTKELDKNYADDTNFSFLDDMEIKKLQTIYYWVILAIGIIFYSIF
ncbi:hypothetical protein N9K34_02880 [Candidatus Pelagibacter bacterium]|nr:hypothetical protein [Candidatus Pelagibacter bacterium]